MTKLNGNKLIAEFVGFKFNGYIAKAPEGSCFNSLFKRDHAIQFHKSWDWLMPVIEKIEELGYTVHAHSNCCDIYTPTSGNPGMICQMYSNSKISATFEALTEFIRLYNDKKI